LSGTPLAATVEEAAERETCIVVEVRRGDTCVLKLPLYVCFGCDAHAAALPLGHGVACK